MGTSVGAYTAARSPKETGVRVLVLGNTPKSFAPEVETAGTSSLYAGCGGRQLRVPHILPPIPQATGSACSTQGQKHWCSWELY